MEWTDLRAAGVVQDNTPSAREGHAMTAIGKDIYLFGGFTCPFGEEEAVEGAGRKEGLGCATK